MRTLRMIGVGAAVLLLSAGTAFAQGRPTTAGRPPAGVTASTTQQALGWMPARERMQTVRADVRARMVSLKQKADERLAEVQDKVKQQMAQKLVNQFEKLNTVWTDHFMTLIERYDAIVKKMQSRSSIAAASGKNVTAANAAITAAQSAIMTAKNAVVAQAARVYTLDPATIATTTPAGTQNDQAALMQKLRSSFQSIHRSLFADLFALRDGPMADARKALQNALEALGQVPGIDGGTATSTAKSNQ